MTTTIVNIPTVVTVTSPEGTSTSVVRENTIVSVAAPGPQGPPGTTVTSGLINAPTLVGGEWAVPLTSNWGVTPAGAVYYDAAGAVPDEAAVASLDADGHLILTQPAGD